WIKSIGFKPGEVLAIVSPNHIHYPIALLGTIAFGGTVTTANPDYTVDELTYQLTDSKASNHCYTSVNLTHCFKSCKQ
ncbi:11202_t:CDS:2, partial [Entrophospora sp. SA101]